MELKTFFLFVGIIFTIVGILHLLRAVFSWSLQVGTFNIPLWTSWVAVVILAYLSYTAFKFSKK